MVRIVNEINPLHRCYTNFDHSKLDRFVEAIIATKTEDIAYIVTRPRPGYEQKQAVFSMWFDVEDPVRQKALTDKLSELHRNPTFVPMKEGDYTLEYLRKENDRMSENYRQACAKARGLEAENGRLRHDNMMLRSDNAVFQRELEMREARVESISARINQLLAQYTALVDDRNMWMEKYHHLLNNQGRTVVLRVPAGLNVVVEKEV